MLNGVLERAEGDNAADIRKELQDEHVRPRVRRAQRGEPVEDGGDHRWAAGALRRVAITDKGAIYNTDLMETVELGYLLDCAQALVVSARARTESRGGHYRDDHPAARRRELAEAHARLPQRRRLDPAGLQAREDGSLRADGEEVLMATPADVLQDSDRRRAGGAPPARSRSRLKIRRFNPEVSQDSWWDEFTVQADPLDRLVEVLHQVKWYHDGTLSFRRSCAHGICGSDAMLINGRNALACKVLVDDVGSKVTIEPIRGLPVLKDLIVDMDPFLDGYKSVLPVPDQRLGRARAGAPAVGRGALRFDDTTKCILCAACTTSCPIFWGDEGYVGPAAIVNAHRFIFDSRDEGSRERLKILSEKTGVFRCRTTFNCTEACPRGIQVTKAIQEVKRSILFDRFEDGRTPLLDLTDGPALRGAPR